MDFAAANGFSPLLLGAASGVEVRRLILYFAVHLRETRANRGGDPIKAVTIDQYVTHVADYLVSREYLPDGGACRSQRLHMLLAGYRLRDDAGLPARLLQKIPMTYALACHMYTMVGDVIEGQANQDAMRAAIAIGYGLSLRPGEYLDMGGTTCGQHQLDASSCFFAFGEAQLVCVCDPQLYPAGVDPTSFFVLLDHTKNQKRGEGGPRAVSATDQPHTEQHFGCVPTIFRYFQRYPGRPHALALASHGRAVKWTDLRVLCHLVAQANNLDPQRLVPHSFRSGAVAQIELESEERMAQQGGWLSVKGVRVYIRKALAHANSVSAQLHDPSACPLEQTAVLFGDHSNGTVYAPPKGVINGIWAEREQV
jgi:hypothetical protein